jgi:hypothetical protein
MIEVLEEWHQELLEWDELTNEEKTSLPQPECPPLWNITDVTSNKELMAAYHSSSPEQKAGWIATIIDKCDPTKKVKTTNKLLATDVTRTNNLLLHVVSACVTFPIKKIDSLYPRSSAAKPGQDNSLYYFL